MREETNQKFNFVILCPEKNYGGFFTTINSLRSHYPQAKCVAIVPDGTTKKEEEERSSFSCPVYFGETTITSLINSGLKNNSDWSIFMFEGAYMYKGVVKRLFTPIKDKKDIVFPITPEYDRLGKPFRLHMTFPESTINGMTIHHDAIGNVGELTSNPLEVSRTFWCLDALNKGYRFNGILGCRIT